MSDPPLSPRPWSCPSCGRRVPARAAVCHCGMTRERALELAAATGPEGAVAEPAARRAREGLPTDVRALLAAAGAVVVLGVGWAALAPPRGETTTPVLGWVDPGPPDPAALRARGAPPQPPFRLPWWKKPAGAPATAPPPSSAPEGSRSTAPPAP